MSRTQGFGLTLLVWIAVAACWLISPARWQPPAMPTLPDQMGAWTRSREFFCQNTNCSAALEAVPLRSADRCPTCQGQTCQLSLGEKAFVHSLASSTVFRYECQQAELVGVRAWFCLLAPRETPVATDWPEKFWLEPGARGARWKASDWVTITSSLPPAPTASIGTTDQSTLGFIGSQGQHCIACFRYSGSQGAAEWRWEDRTHHPIEAAGSGRKQSPICVGLLCTYPALTPANQARLEQRLAELNYMAERYLDAAARKPK